MLIEVKLNKRKTLTYESISDIELGATVEVPAPYWLDGQQYGTVVSLESDFQGEVTNIIRVLNAEQAAEVKAIRAEAAIARNRRNYKPPRRTCGHPEAPGPFAPNLRNFD